MPLVSASSRSRWRTRLAGLRLDVTPLRTSRDFRVLFVAGFVFFLGAMVGYVAVPYQLYALTGSNFAVGAYGLVQLVPLVLAGLYGGALADRLDRRRVLVLTGVAQVAGTAVLLVNALAAHPSLPVIYGVGVLMAVAQSLQSPSREALVPRTVRHAELPAAVALSSVGAQVGMLAGPALGGVLLATVGTPWAYGVTLAGFAGATALFTLLRPYRPLETPSAAGTVREIRDGIVYAVRRPDLLGTYVVDMVAMFLAMPVVLFPALATDVLEKPALLGLLYSAGTVGSLVATATSGWTARVHHHGRAVVLSAAAWGASVVLAGLTTVPALVLLGLVLAGAFDMISGLFRGTIWHQTIPDSHRGRLAGIEMLSYTWARSAGRHAPGWWPTRPRCGRRSSAAGCCASPEWAPHAAAACARSGTTTRGRTSTRCGSARCGRRGRRRSAGRTPARGQHGGFAAVGVQQSHHAALPAGLRGRRAPGRRRAADRRGRSAPAAAGPAPARGGVPGGAASTARTAGRPATALEPGPVGLDDQRDHAAAVRRGQRGRLGRRHRARAPGQPSASAAAARWARTPRVVERASPPARPAPARRTAARSAPAAAAPGTPRSPARPVDGGQRARRGSPPRRTAPARAARAPAAAGCAGSRAR